MSKKLRHYLTGSAFLSFATAPVIWFCLFPALFMDLTVTVYQIVCFPVYGIPKVRKKDYIVIDRHYPGYPIRTR